MGINILLPLFILNKEMKAAYLLSFVLLVLYIISGAVRNCSGHDHFLLVQTWPNGYCSIANCHDSPLNFVLHGLWPVDRNGTSLHNYTTPSIRMIDIVYYLFPFSCFRCSFSLSSYRSHFSSF